MSVCAFQCWRRQAGLHAATGARLRLSRSHTQWFGDPPVCDGATCDCTTSSSTHHAPRGDQNLHAGRGGASGLLTHAVVAATRYTGANGADAAAGMCERWRRDVLQAGLLPPSSVFYAVDNASPAPVQDALRRACHDPEARMRYARNDDWAAGRGFELGAWRWAVLHVLPTLPLAEDALVYLLQDSLYLRRPALPYPPPAGFRAASLLSFHEPRRRRRRNVTPPPRGGGRRRRRRRQRRPPRSSSAAPPLAKSRTRHGRPRRARRSAASRARRPSATATASAAASARASSRRGPLRASCAAAPSSTCST